MDKNLLSRVRKQTWFYRYPRGLPIILFLLVCLAIVGIVTTIELSDERQRSVELERNATEISAALRQRTTENIAFLRAAARLFEARKIASQAELVILSKELLPEDENYGALGLGWAIRTEASEIPAFEKKMRTRGFPAFKVWPRAAGDSRPAVAVTYISPLSAENQPAIGYDMYSENMRRQAMDEAARLRQPVATGRVELVQQQASAERSGFLIYMPVFALGTGRLRGFVYTPFISSELLASAVRLTAARAVNIAIYDGAVRPARLLVERRLQAKAHKTTVQPLQIGNRTWLVAVTSTTPNGLTQLSQLVVLAGSLFAISLLTISYLILRRAADDRQAFEWQSEQASIRSTLSRELNHRVKNTLANVLSIAALTRRRTNDIDTFYESFTGRVQALSATHDLLTKSEWSNTLIGDVIRSELKPYTGRMASEIVLTGPDVGIASSDALSLGLAIHELATNAAKYGALSNETGKVLVTWQKISPELCEVRWRETGGPVVVPPSGRGFGRELLERILAQELHSDVRLQFEPEGVECLLRIPVRHMPAFALRSGNK